MGINAKIFVRYVGEPPTQECLDIWNENLNYKINTRSFAISKSKIKVIGKNFSIEKNQPWDEYYYNDKLIETNEEFTVLDMNVCARYFCEYYDRGNILYLDGNQNDIDKLLNLIDEMITLNQNKQ